ncbi:hypothetical protein EON63_24810 [archaeon]|nr:MAG: hypothetical protein EON63_24810 [archaeon]
MGMDMDKVMAIDNGDVDGYCDGNGNGHGAVMVIGNKIYSSGGDDGKYVGVVWWRLIIKKY